MKHHYSLNQRGGGGYKEPLFKGKRQKPESQKIKKIIQKEGPSENRDPPTDLGVAAWEKLPD